jgi:predicted secreted Zn-dependent protease
MATKKKKMNLTEQAGEILRIAEASGAETNFFFVTTFKRYQVQIKMLNDLEKVLSEEGTLVTKEYVKGRKNLYSNPALREYNNTTNSANKTVETLMKILKGFDGGSDEEDELLKILNGVADDDESNRK